MYMLMNIYVILYYESVQLLYTTVSNGTVLIWAYISVQYRDTYVLLSYVGYHYLTTPSFSLL